MDKSKEYLRPAAAAERIGCAMSTFWEWVKSKPNFPQPNRISARFVLFSTSEIDAFVKADHRVKSVVGERLLEGRKRKARLECEGVAA